MPKSLLASAESAPATLAPPSPTLTTAAPALLPTLSPTVSASVTPMPSTTPTPPPPLALFVGSTPNLSAACDRTVVQGTIHDGVHVLDGVRVRVWAADAAPDEGFSAPSGSDAALGAGTFQVLLGDQPTAGWWLVAVVDDAGALRSEAMVVETTAEGCDDGSGRQRVQINFWRSQGALGVAGPTLTPVPPIVIATATPVPAPPPPGVEPSPTATALPDWDGLARALNVPILMYHYISVPPPGSDTVRRDLSVGPDVFRAQLITLREQGYTSITLSQLLYALQRGTPLPEKPVVLTFDDGYSDNYVNAFPIMQQEGFVGTFFVITEVTEQRNVDYMTWEQVVEMKEAGMEIGSHTRTHPSLPGMSVETIWRELAESRALLQQRLGQEVNSFAYPYGRFDDGVAHLTAVAGYHIAVVTKQGAHHTTDNMMTLRRIRVRGGMFPEDVIKAIRYWMAQAAK